MVKLSDILAHKGRVILFPYNQGEYQGAVRIVTPIEQVGESNTFRAYDFSRLSYRSFCVHHIETVTLVQSSFSIPDVDKLPLSVSELVELFKSKGRIAAKVGTMVIVV